MSYSDPMTYAPYPGSIPCLVLEFFASNPDEELSSADIAVKFPHTGSASMSSRMVQLVSMGLLKSVRHGRVMHYQAGDSLPAWAAHRKGNQ